MATDRENEIKRTLVYWKQALFIEREHRWYYDWYTNPDIVFTATPIEDAQRAKIYKDWARNIPDWRAILHNAEELKLPLPETLNLKRYSNI